MATFRPGKPRSLRGLSTDYAPGAGNQTVSFDVDDQEGEWGLGSSATQLVVEIAGGYLCSFAAGRSIPGSALTWTVSLRINAAAVTGPIVASNAVAVAAQGSWFGELETGDTIDLRIGGAGTGNLVALRTHLHVIRLAPVRWT